MSFIVPAVVPAVLHSIIDTILDIIYPENMACCLCNTRQQHIEDDFEYGGLDDSGICRACRESLPFIVPPVCNKCGKPVLLKGDVCPDCRNTRHFFQQAISAFEYEAEVQRIIRRYKYNGEIHLKQPMIKWMLDKVKTKKQWDFEIIIPVPLYRTRQRKRGFNQAALLAYGIGKGLGVKVVENNLIRIKDTSTQVTAGKYQRLRNLEGAFSVRDSLAIKGKSILLVDDVYTTGSTADQCSKVLLNAGARRVYVLTLATGRNM